LATHSTPAKAKQLKLEFVRAYAKCMAPGSSTSNVFPACAPVTEPDPCNFGPKGKGKGKLSILVGDVGLKVKLSGLNDACEGLTLNLNLDILGWTLDDCAGASCTVVDLSDFLLSTCTVANGKCSIDTTINAVVPGMILAGKRSDFALGSVSIFDG